MTDTIGFPDDIPRWLVTSFRGTLEVIDAADLLVLVIDADQTDKEVERKVSTSFDTLRQDHPPIVPVLNKIDRVSQHDVRRRSAILDDIVGSPIQIGAIEATGCDPRADAICDDLPPLVDGEFDLPLDDPGMALLSWLHDEAVRIDTT